MDLEYEASYEDKIYSLLNIAVVVIALIIFLVGFRKLALVPLILFPLIRTFAKKDLTTQVIRGEVVVLDDTVQKKLEGASVKSYMFYRLGTGLNGSKKVEVAEMAEDDYPCECQIELSCGRLTVIGIDYLGFQFINHYLKKRLG